MATWEKFNTKLFIDISENHDGTEWARLRKSTVFDLAFNAETETFDFIDQQVPTEFIKGYKPSMSQETAMMDSDPLFNYMFELMQSLPTGEDAIRKCMVVFPKEKTTGHYVAWNCECVITFSNYNAVDRKISFNIGFSGDMDKGTATVSEDGNTPTFIPDGK